MISKKDLMKINKMIAGHQGIPLRVLPKNSDLLSVIKAMHTVTKELMSVLYGSDVKHSDIKEYMNVRYRSLIKSTVISELTTNPKSISDISSYYLQDFADYCNPRLRLMGLPPIPITVNATLDPSLSLQARSFEKAANFAAQYGMSGSQLAALSASSHNPSDQADAMAAAFQFAIGTKLLKPEQLATIQVTPEV